MMMPEKRRGRLGTRRGEEEERAIDTIRYDMKRVMGGEGFFTGWGRP